MQRPAQLDKRNRAHEDEVMDTAIDKLRDHMDAVRLESNRRMDRSDAQFRWLVGLMIATMLGTASLLLRTI
ncbi:hypothetical protein KW842_09945 [Duganella sp. sic0402]|uniref:hypothetical protein n=1 Tax=Duganella sp. sic0402 TaxID=2854786 RepID=UPI001C479D74|nr:hypothetical protein [Duganella sp. sic0402]MBV7536085.1 hypothetical protein [Duganella sp. sic0402]